MIREANHDDMWQLLELCEEFFYNSHLQEFCSFDEESMRGTLVQLLDSDKLLLLVMEKEGLIVGMLAMVTGDAFYNSKVMMAQELFWYVKPAFRGSIESIKLIKEAEKWATDIGAKVCILAHLLSENQDKLHRFYENSGFNHKEAFYYKRIK